MRVSRVRNRSTSYSRFKLRLSLLSRIEQDEQVRLFFTALAETSCDVLLRPIVEELLVERPRLTEEHLAYLLFAAFQYVSDFRYDTIDSFTSETAVWQDLKVHNRQLLQICLRKCVSTHCINRYAALQIILAIVQEPEVTIVDLGCAGGFGLMSLNTHFVRRVRTSDALVALYLDQGVDIGKAVGVDLASQSRHDLRWVKACFLPERRQLRRSIDAEYHWLRRHGVKVHLIEADFLDIPDTGALAPNSTDVVWTSSTLYQIGDTLDDSLQLIKPVIDYLLVPGGLWLDAHYSACDRPFGGDENSYQISVRSAQDFDDPLVVLTAPNDNVPVIGEGTDFHTFVDRYATT